MTRLTCDLDDRCTLREEERAEEVSEVVRASCVESDSFSRRGEDASSPVPVRGVSPRLSSLARKNERLRVGPARGDLPLGQVRCDWSEQSNGSGLARLRRLHLSKRKCLL